MRKALLIAAAAALLAILALSMALEGTLRGQPQILKPAENAGARQMPAAPAAERQANEAALPDAQPAPQSATQPAVPAADPFGGKREEVLALIRLRLEFGNYTSARALADTYAGTGDADLDELRRLAGSPGEHRRMRFAAELAASRQEILDWVRGLIEEGNHYAALLAARQYEPHDDSELAALAGKAEERYVLESIAAYCRESTASPVVLRAWYADLVRLAPNNPEYRRRLAELSGADRGRVTPQAASNSLNPVSPPAVAPPAVAQAPDISSKAALVSTSAPAATSRPVEVETRTVTAVSAPAPAAPAPASPVPAQPVYREMGRKNVCLMRDDTLGAPTEELLDKTHELTRSTDPAPLDDLERSGRASRLARGTAVSRLGPASDGKVRVRPLGAADPVWTWSSSVDCR